MTTQASRGRADRAADPQITDIQKEFGASRSKRQRYADLVIGETPLNFTGRP